MTTPVSVFDSAIEKWLDNENRPWGKLKTTLTREHLLRHLPAGPLRILDVGGGTGIDSLPFAVDGHFVEIADYSASMLEVARDAVQREGLAARVTLHHAEFAVQVSTSPEVDVLHKKLLSAGATEVMPPHDTTMYEPMRFSCVDEVFGVRIDVYCPLINAA